MLHPAAATNAVAAVVHCHCLCCHFPSCCCIVLLLHSTAAIAATMSLLCSLCCLCCCLFLWLLDLVMLLQQGSYPYVVSYRGCTLVPRPVPTSPGPGSCNCPSGVHRSCAASWCGSGHVCQHPTQLWHHSKCSRWVLVVVCSIVCLYLP